ncbi:MAG: type II toxin-antitoxin system RelE/ParE family toxin [Candidatus Cloacimonadota bacterium]|nr:type II toxin-antitoxin system RelE/ParE family toxin [Candidatus Cloacimonadota bacterium]
MGNKIYVLHTFKKKSKKGIKTPKPDIELVRKRLHKAQRLAQEERNEK